MSKLSKSVQPIASFPEDLDDDGWMDMPIIRSDEFAGGMDEEDRKKYHYMSPETDKEAGATGGNATGNLIDFDGQGNEWRAKLEQNESEYTRLRLHDDDDTDEVHLRTRYLFDEDKAMTPLSQMQATKNLLTEAQRIAYVGLCSLICREMIRSLKMVGAKELALAITHMDLWSLKIMGRLYHHMELATAEQKMIESLADHGVQASDLTPALMTTHTVANPEYDPEEARLASQKQQQEEKTESTPSAIHPVTPTTPTQVKLQTTVNVLGGSSAPLMEGVSTSLSASDENVTLDIRWTVLCDLFLTIIADSVYDARSRVLLENVAKKLGLGWSDVTKFEKRVTDALEIQEATQSLENSAVIDGRIKAAKKKRYVMMGLATIGGGLVIGLSAGLLAPVIGAGLGAAFTTIGITGTGTFLAGAGGAAIITTGGVLTGSSIAGKGMARRTQQVRIFDLLPLHNNKRVNCIITVPGFMTSPQDDVRLPFSVLDPIVGDVFSVLWEPEMMGEMGNALKILTSEVLSQVGQTVLQATVMTALMTALQWPLILTKLGYLIDNPWSNALDRARAAGLVLADILLHRSLGVRPITLIGFSLGARMIFYALLELARQKAFGIVQDVFLLGATLTAPRRTWLEARSVVAGRFVNGFARNDWVLNYLFRATSGGLNTVAGLRPVESVPGLDNVDLTDKIAGHNSYRAFMPLILDQLGFPVSADYFDEPEELEMEQDRIVIRDDEEAAKAAKKSRFSFFSRKKSSPANGTTTASAEKTSLDGNSHPKPAEDTDDDDLPERMEQAVKVEPRASEDSLANLPKTAGFDFEAIKAVLGKPELDTNDIRTPVPGQAISLPVPTPQPPLLRSGSAPLPHASPPPSPPAPISRLPLAPEPSSDEVFKTTSSHHRFERSVSLGNHVQGTEDSEAEQEPQTPSNAQSSPADVPFSSSSGGVWGSDAVSSNTLTFGAHNGTISLPEPDDDPWETRPTPSFSGPTNPWST